MSNEEIRELIQLVFDTGLAELEVQRGEDRVRIRRAFESAQAPVLIAAPAPSAASALPEKPAAKADSELVYVKSPIVGTFYEASSPGAPPLVRVGEHVAPGKVVCIIESMKLMNPIEAEVAGVVESKLVGNGEAVEYGEALFGIRPV